MFRSAQPTGFRSASRTLALATAKTGTQAFLAIETPEGSWPAIPGKNGLSSAGPFYIVWNAANSHGPSSEYWAYHVASLNITDSPFKRGPELNVSDSVALSDPIRLGLDRFVAVCMACHRFNAAGKSDVGPDLARPMKPVDYFRTAALKQFIRNPSSLRVWADQKMPSF